MKFKVWDSVICHFREFVAKVNKSGSWSKSPVKKYYNFSWATAQDTTLIPDYDDEDPDVQYKWGYTSLQNAYSNSTDKLKAKTLYLRILNARKYGHSVDKYKYTKFGTTTRYTYNSKNTITIGTITISALQVYISDVDASNTMVIQAKQAVEHDWPELNSRWCWYEVGGNGTGYYTYSIKSSTLYLPYHPTSDYEHYRDLIKVAFDEICQIIKSTHNIDYVDQRYHLNNKLYTPEQKIKIAKVIHDYLVTRNNYGSNATPFTGDQELWPAMSNYESDPVCISYAKAFTYCCWRWGISALTVYGVTGYDQNAGTSNGNHAWNMVTYEPITALDSGYTNSDNWNEVDITWDDPTNWSGTMCRWKYFNRTTDWLNGDEDGSSRDRSIYNNHSNWAVMSYPCVSTNTSYTKYLNYTNGGNSTTYLWKW